MGLVILACASCVTSTIVAVPTKLQYFKNYKNRDICSCNYLNGHENGEHMMASNLLFQASFYGYNNLKPEQVAKNVIILSKCDIFGILQNAFGKSLDKIATFYISPMEGFMTLSKSPYMRQNSHVFVSIFVASCLIMCNVFFNHIASVIMHVIRRATNP